MPDGADRSPPDLEHVLEGAGVGFWSLDVGEGRLTVSGPFAAIIGGPEGASYVTDLAGFIALIHPDDRDHMIRPDERRAAVGLVEDEFRVVWPTGEVRWVLSRSRMVRDEAGNPLQLMGLALDITERKQAEEELARTTKRLQQLQAVTEAGLARLPIDELLDELLRRVVTALEADTATMLLTEEGDVLRVRASVGIEPGAAANVAIPVGTGFAGGIAATGERRSADLDDGGYLLGVPLVVDERTIGVLQVGRRGEPFELDDEAVLQTVGDRVALAVDRAAAYEHQRVIAETLQVSLLPYHLPDVPGLALGATYRPGAAGTAVGGDWYDAVPMGDGLLVVSIGDVAGHGVRAATTMGQLRNASRMLVTEGWTVDRVVGRLNELVIELGDAEIATVASVVVEPRTGTVTWVSAGHPPPFVRAPDGTVRFLDGWPDPPLGAERGTVHTARTETIEPGSTLVLYTDGLVERRDEDMGVGLARLAAAASSAECADDVNGCCAHLVDACRPPRGFVDDVAVVAVQLRVPAPPLSRRYPSEPASLSALRRDLRAWLRSHVSEDVADDVVQAAAEAAANAVQHGHPSRTGSIELSASLVDGSVRIGIRDWGTWHAPEGVDRGRGMTVIEALVDELAVVRHDDGTEVVLRRHV